MKYKISKHTLNKYFNTLENFKKDVMIDSFCNSNYMNFLKIRSVGITNINSLIFLRSMFKYEIFFNRKCNKLISKRLTYGNSRKKKCI